MTPRTVTLALVDAAGTPLGTLPLGAMPTPWWQEVGDVVRTANTAHGTDVTVLRLLTAEHPHPPGGQVTYLAELTGTPPEGMSARGDPAWTAPHPKRMPWANPGGPATSLAWARNTLARNGNHLTDHHQIRTWNLSALWCLDTAHGPVWLKEVPPFNHHEPAVLAWLDGPSTPHLIAAGQGRMLLADIPGADRYDATDTERAEMLTDLLDIQTRAAAELPRLLARGIPDQRTAALTHHVTQTVDTAPLSRTDRATLHQLAATIRQLDDCGIPDTLIHGDFHPGNVRTADGRHVILDWADSAIAHPAFDLIRMRPGTPEADRRLTAQWCAHWRRTCPGSDPERAAALAEPLAALRDAATYAAFVAAIEPAERPYHADDVTVSLTRALQTSQRA